MNKQLNKKRLATLKKMEQITSLRQGSLTEQYVMRGKGTERYRLGPYYIRTWYEDGEKHTEHIPGGEARQMQAHIKNYQKIKDLFDDLLDITEQITLKK